MSQLIIVTSAQLNAYRVRFEKLLAEDQTEQARLKEIDERRQAEWDRLRDTRPASPPRREEGKTS